MCRGNINALQWPIPSDDVISMTGLVCIFGSIEKSQKSTCLTPISSFTCQILISFKFGTNMRMKVWIVNYVGTENGLNLYYSLHMYLQCSFEKCYYYRSTSITYILQVCCILFSPKKNSFCSRVWLNLGKDYSWINWICPL